MEGLPSHTSQGEREGGPPPCAAAAIGLKVDHAELREAWNAKVLRLVACIALLIWGVAALLVFAAVGPGPPPSS